MPSTRVYPRSSTNLPECSPIGGSGGALLTYWWGTTNSAGQTLDPRQLYFPLSESGQTVAVDYYRKKDGAFIQGEMHTIGGPQVVDLGVWACGLSDWLKDDPSYAPDPVNNPTYVLGPITVRGMSVRARAVWVGKGRRATMNDVAEKMLGAGTGPPKQSLDESWYEVILTTFIPRTPI